MADPKKGPKATSEKSAAEKSASAKPSAAKPGTASAAKPASRAVSALRPGNPASRQRTESLAFLAISAGILVALNVIGVVVFHRFDATRNRAYSLAAGSRRVVSELD